MTNFPRRHPPSKRNSRKLTSKTQYKTTESGIAIALVDYVNKARPFLKDYIVKLDNEGRTSWQLGKQKKREGKKKGASDYFIAWPMPQYFGLWLEIKTEQGKESPEQKEFGHKMMARGYQYRCVYGIDAAIEELDRYLGKYNGMCE
jgi:hypothetical protein